MSNVGFLSGAKQGKRLKAGAKQLLLNTEGCRRCTSFRSRYWALDSVVKTWPSLSGEDGFVDPPLNVWYAALNDPDAANRAVRMAAFSGAGFSSLARETSKPLDRLEAAIGIESEHEAAISELARGLTEDQDTRYWRGTIESMLAAADAAVPAEGYTNLGFIHS